MRQLYLRVLERIIVYGAPAWWKQNTHLTRKLNSIQRIPLLKIAQAFKTVPNGSLPVLCDVLPITERIHLEVQSFLHTDLRLPLPPDNSSPLASMQCEGKHNIWNTHPADHYQFQFHKQSKIITTRYTIYTDGSRTWTQLEWPTAFYTTKTIKSVKVKLPSYASIFEAELLALVKAIENVMTNSYDGSLQIYTESISTSSTPEPQTQKP